MRKLTIALAVLLVVMVAGCNGEPTPQTTCVVEQSILAQFAIPDVPAPTAGDWSRGPVDAEVTVILYSDFQ